MKILVLLLATILALLGFVSAQGKCRRPCNRMYRPVCAESQLMGPRSRCTIGNECELMNLQRCYPTERWRKYRDGVCAGPHRACRVRV